MDQVHPSPPPLRPSAGIIDMKCSDNEAHINITIPVVMLSKLDGDPLQKSIADGRKGKLWGSSNFLSSFYAEIIL